MSSVHTSDLSSFDGESDDEQPTADSTEEGEITSEGEPSYTGYTFLSPPMDLPFLMFKSIHLCFHVRR